MPTQTRAIFHCGKWRCCRYPWSPPLQTHLLVDGAKHGAPLLLPPPLCLFEPLRLAVDDVHGHLDHGVGRTAWREVQETPCVEVPNEGSSATIDINQRITIGSTECCHMPP